MMQEFVQEISNSTKKEIRNIHTAMPGTIIALDSEKMLATVQPVVKFKKPDGETMDFPQLTGVPLVFPQGVGQQVSICFPVKVGDGCLVVIAEQALDYWMYDQETDTDLAFDLTNAICIPGLFKTPNATMREACDSNAVIVDAKGTKVIVKKGSIQIDAETVEIKGNVTINGNLTTSGGTVRLN